MHASPGWYGAGIAGFNVGDAYTSAVYAAGWPAPTFAVTDGKLPAGIELDAGTGVISGTATVAGPYSFEITASNAAGTVTETFTGAVNQQVTWTAEILSQMIVGAPYEHTLTAVGYPAPTYSVFSGPLPAGIELDADTGVLSGTPTSTGHFSIMLRATNTSGPSVTRVLSGWVYEAIGWDDQTISGFQVGHAYNDAVHATGYPAPTYQVTAGALPAGITLGAATGSLTGTPTAAGTYTFTIAATNGYVDGVTKTFTGIVVQAPTWTDRTLAGFVHGQTYDDRVAAKGTPAPTYTITAGTLPAGIALNGTTGAVSGTPTAAGAYTFTVAAANGIGTAATATFTGTIVEPVTGNDGPGSGAMQPERLADTRETGGGKLAADETFRLPVAGADDTAANATTVTVNITVTEPDAAGYVTVWPCGEPRPATSSVNFAAAQTVAVAVTVAVGDGGEICMDSSTPTHLVTDIQHATFDTDTNGLTPVAPQRLLDTREGAGKLTPGTEQRVSIDGVAGVFNLTVTEPTAAGYIVAYPCGGDVPWVSNLNYLEHQTVANTATVAAGDNGQVCFRSLVDTHLVVDLTGTYGPDGAKPTAGAPYRVLDTRDAGGRITGGEIVEVDLGADGAAAALVNVTVTEPLAPGYITAWACGDDQPFTSNVNYQPWQTITNTAIVGGDTLCVYAHADTHLVVDVNVAYRNGSA